MNRDSFIFYRSFFEALKGMDSETQGKCLMALADYALNGNEPSQEPEVMMFFTLAKPQIDANNRRYENGTKGGRPKNQTITKTKPNNNQNETKVKPNVNVNDNVNVNVIKENNIKEKFEDFWRLYTPIKAKDGHFVSKGNKQSCLAKYMKLIKEGENYETIINGLKQYLTYCRDNGICSCGAEVFLNQRRFENDYSDSECVNSQPTTSGQRKPVSIVEIAAKLTRESQVDDSDSIPF